MKNIGIFGGGQLAKMICIEGYKMGLNFNVFDPNENACCKPLADNFYKYDFLNEEKIDEFFKLNDIFTYEFENVKPDLLEKHKDKIPQGIEALKVLQDRYTEKTFVNELDGVKTVKFSLANEQNDIKVPFIIKTRRDGYDGKGQTLIKDLSEVNDEFLNENYIIEEFIEDIVEYSIVIGRSATGETFNYSPINNIHKKGILHQSTFANDLDKELTQKMVSKAKNIIEALDYKGVLCVEFFVKGSDVYVNEIAPRVHNSGHLTFEASNVSQFKLHLLCILGMKVPKLECYDDYYMINVLGHDLDNVEKMQQDDKFKNCNFHIYGKNSYVKNRKVGHITFKNENGLLENVKSIVVGGIN